MKISIKGSALILYLDCGDEFMRRKIEREEPTSGKRASSKTLVTYSDALVKELNGDLESLKFPEKIKGSAKF